MIQKCRSVTKLVDKLHEINLGVGGHTDKKKNHVVEPNDEGNKRSGCYKVKSCVRVLNPSTMQILQYSYILVL